MADSAEIIETPQESLSRLAQEIRFVLLPGSRVSVKSYQGKTTLIRPSRHRWWPISCCLAVGLLHILPFIITYFVVPETSPKRPEIMSKAIILSVFSLLWFWLALRGILCYGKISWRNDLSELTLHYGSLLFPKKLKISTDGLAVKIYIYKADKPEVRLKYGWIILSLIRLNQPDDELIIVKAKKRKFVEGAFRSLKDFLGQGIDEIAVEEPDSSSDLLPLDIESSWEKLSRKTRAKGPFFGSMWTKNISMKFCSEGVVFKWDWKRWLLLLVLLPCGGFMYFGAFYLFEPTIRGIFLFAAGLGMGTLFTYPCIKVILAGEKISLNNWNSTVIIRYGILPFAKTLTISAERLEAKMYRCEASQANKVIKPGYILLSLHDKKLNSEFIIAAASKKSLIMPLYEKLAEFLKQPHLDELLEEIELSDGQKIRISRESLTGGGNSEDRKRTFRILSDDTAVFSRGWREIAAGVFLAVMFTTIAVAVLFDKNEKSKLAGVIIIMVLLLAVAAFGAGVAIYFWLSRHLVVEKSNNKILRRAFLTNRGKGKLVRAISDIAAVQACSILGKVQSGNNVREVTIFEINLVLKNSDNKRINITAGQNTTQIKDDAEQFALFLGVPLIDHT